MKLFCCRYDNIEGYILHRTRQHALEKNLCFKYHKVKQTCGGRTGGNLQMGRCVHETSPQIQF